MTDTQLYLMIGVPVLFNAIFVGLVMVYINAKSESRRFDSMRDRWSSELNSGKESLDV